MLEYTLKGKKMTKLIKAIFKNGVFQPKESVELPDDQEVDILVSTQNKTKNSSKSLILQIDDFREKLLHKTGYFDSTSLIRQDRDR